MVVKLLQAAGVLCIQLTCNYEKLIVIIITSRSLYSKLTIHIPVIKELHY